MCLLDCITWWLQSDEVSTPTQPLKKELEIYSEDFCLLGRIDIAQEQHLCTTRGEEYSVVKTYQTSKSLKYQIAGVNEIFVHAKQILFKW